MNRTILSSLVFSFALATMDASGALANVVTDKTITEVQVLPDMLLIRAEGATFSYSGSSTNTCSDNSAVIPQTNVANYLLMHQLAVSSLLSGRKVRIYINSCINGRPKVGEIHLL
jgi:hypothetical protein